MYKHTTPWILGVSEFLSNVQRRTPSIRAVLSSWVVVPSLSVQWFLCQTTFISMDQVSDHSLFTRMTLLFQGLSSCHFSKLPYSLQASLASIQVMTLEWELQLLLPRRASLTILLSSRKICVASIWAHLPPFILRFFFSGCRQNWAFWVSLFSHHEPPFLWALPSLLRDPLAWHGGSWLGCQDLPAMGVVSI